PHPAHPPSFPTRRSSDLHRRRRRTGPRPRPAHRPGRPRAHRRLLVRHPGRAPRRRRPPHRLAHGPAPVRAPRPRPDTRPQEAPMTRSVADIIAALGTGIHVDGAWRDAADGKTFPVVNPATGQSVATIADAAIETAGRVQPGWAAVPARERAEILRRAHELLVERTEELALLMTTEMGKPLGDARGEVAYGAEFFRWFSEEACRIRGDA